MEYLEKAVELGYENPGGIAADEDLKSLRGDSRFEAIVARAKEPFSAARKIN